ncbi:ABC transporter substrate-binding protein [Desulfovibrio legallii]|uniref:ABC-type Fe3+ transport system, substrate-binding protein n=1 Tax=Desulfovibrio legallii TaxID=571438 RepID=A0A1G7JXR4_9BACT|nr:ABC transporter substrate-binding protein [Desulfovibrio legallii]SDF29642.1 ABC-type Fe3+ transport system, substrate-binding protein [Desulfovibrio legallii]
MRSLDALVRSLHQAEDVPETGTPDLLLYTPCPVKLVVKERVEALAAAAAPPLTAHIPMGCTVVDPFDPLYMETDPDKLPAVIASIGFGDFWRPEFVRRFVHNGLFAAVRPRAVNPLYTEAAMADPAGAYTIYGVTPYIFLADANKLGGLPLPRTWGDLLHPRYKGQIVMCGDGDDMADAVLLNIYKEYGRAGLAALAGNVKSLMHSSRMVKVCGTSAPDAGGIFIIPLFFARSVSLPPGVAEIWPEDGAAASPLYFLAKKSEQKRLAPLLDFLVNGFCGIDSAAWFIPLGAARDARLPPRARLKWVGWEYAAAHDLNGLRDELVQRFRQSYGRAPCAS